MNYFNLLKEKIQKSAEELLKDPVRCNKLMQTVSHWLKVNHKTVYKLLNQQCIFAIENEFHKKNLVVPESDDENDENEMVINTTNLISYDDFKIGDLFFLLRFLCFLANDLLLFNIFNSRYSTLSSNISTKLLLIIPYKII